MSSNAHDVVLVINPDTLARALHAADCGCDVYDEIEDPRYIDAVRAALGDSETEPGGYRLLPIPTPPFRDLEDERAALGAVLATITHTITGLWPRPAQVLAAVNALHDASQP